MLDDALVLTVYAHSHLPGAINLPPIAVDSYMVTRRIPDGSTEIVVYCASPNCEDSLATGVQLQELGYTNVRHYPGGKNEWRDAGLPSNARELVRPEMTRPKAKDWTDFAQSDAGITLLELFAYLAEQLAYRQEQIAAEARLRTRRRYLLGLAAALAAALSFVCRRRRPARGLPHGRQTGASSSGMEREVPWKLRVPSWPPELIHAADDVGWVMHATGALGLAAMIIAASLAFMWSRAWRPGQAGSGHRRHPVPRFGRLLPAVPLPAVDPDRLDPDVPPRQTCRQNRLARRALLSFRRARCCG